MRRSGVCGLEFIDLGLAGLGKVAGLEVMVQGFRFGLRGFGTGLTGALRGMRKWVLETLTLSPKPETQKLTPCSESITQTA